MKKPPARILIVEDEAPIAELLCVNLRHGGFAPVWVEDGQAAQRALEAALPDAIVLDWMLPGTSGLQLARRWRESEHTRAVPILMLTARGEERDTIAALDAGADDYITKPFSPQELLARIRAVLRRRAPEVMDECITLGALVLDAATCRVSWQGQELALGPTEWRLLHYLMRHPERVHSRARLLDKVWGTQVCLEERTVDVHIKRLRHALGDAAGMVETVRGMGYRMVNRTDNVRVE